MNPIFSIYGNLYNVNLRKKIEKMFNLFKCNSSIQEFNSI